MMNWIKLLLLSWLTQTCWKFAFRFVPRPKSGTRPLNLLVELVQINPNEAQFWISHAYATRRMPGGGIPEAKDILREAQRLFPKEHLIAYNLACYDCQLGDNSEAWKWLKTAFDLGDAEQLTVMALKDPDLKPLWTKIATL